MDQTHTLYQRYKALRTNQHGQLVANSVSNDPIKVAAYREALRDYRNFTGATLVETLKWLSDWYTDDYCEELQNR